MKIVKKSHKNLEGQQFNSWLVLARKPNINSRVVYECKCVCGTVRDVLSCHFVGGASKSCGCQRPNNTRHGHARKGQFTKKYRGWRSIMNRCFQPSQKDYEHYKGMLWEDWKKFENFDRDVPDPPEGDDLSVERIDNSKGYVPGNVTWVTMAQQHRNQSNCRWIEFEGKNSY